MASLYTLPENAGRRAMALHGMFPEAYAIPDIDYHGLNERQMEALQFAAGALQGKHQESVVVHGVGGTGKSHIINAVVKWNADNDTTIDGGPRILVAAPSGQAASLLPGGRTLHSAFKIQVPMSQFKDLDPDALGDLQLTYKESLKLLIIDEFSMVSARLLSAVDQRLRQIMPHQRHLPMGGVAVMFFGDVAQLPPPGGLPS